MTGQQLYEQVNYYALALDPIHVGTGGYRLGQVDLTILREPGTHLPKIPGSSLAGAARAYTAMRYNRYRRYDPEKQKYVSCAGKGGEDGSEHCGEMTCDVCLPYGFTIGPQNRSFHGLAQFYDAQVLFFPVHSMVGPVWVTAPGVLSEAGYDLSPEQALAGHQVRTAPGLVPKTEENRRRGLNLGWLFLDVGGDDLDTGSIWKAMGLPAGLEQVKERLVLVSDQLFSLVVDNNLEVRTSVSIDPATGAAEEGALFTYEALPRGTVLRFPVVYHNPRHYVFPRWENGQTKPEPFPDSQDIAWVEERVVAGLRLMEYLGVGGMNTRGFGRLRILNLPPEKTEGGM